MILADVNKARKFLIEVEKLAKQYSLDFFIVSEGASMYSNSHNTEAVRNARNKQIEWEKTKGFDPNEDWRNKKAEISKVKIK